MHGRGWVDTIRLWAGDRIDTAGEDDLAVASLIRTDRVEPAYNLTVEGWHTFLVGEAGAVVHNVNCRDLLRRLAMQEAHGNPTAVRIMQGRINDPRYPEHI